MRRSNDRVDLASAASTLANGRGAAGSAPYPHACSARPAARVALLSGLGCERRGMAVRASAPEAGENFATRASLLISCRRTAFGFRAIFAGCKSLIEDLYHAEPGHNDPFLLAAEPTKRRSSAIRWRSLLDDLGNVARCGSLPSRSRRACFLARRCPSPDGLNCRHRRSAAGDRGVIGAGRGSSKSSIERLYTPT